VQVTRHMEINAKAGAQQTD